jgi:hypothetical protein
MPPYSWLHLESVFWVLFGGLAFALAIILARASRYLSFTLKKRSEEELEQETHTFAGIIKEQNRPVPVFIWVMIVGYFIWAVGYVIFSGEMGL